MNIPRSQPRPPATKTTDPFALLDEAANEAEQDYPEGVGQFLLSQHIPDLGQRLSLLSLQAQPNVVRKIRESGHKVVAERALEVQEIRKRPQSAADKSKPQASRFKTETHLAETKHTVKAAKTDKCFVDLMADRD